MRRQRAVPGRLLPHATHRPCQHASGRCCRSGAVASLVDRCRCTLTLICLGHALFSSAPVARDWKDCSTPEAQPGLVGSASLNSAHDLASAGLQARTAGRLLLYISEEAEAQSERVAASPVGVCPSSPVIRWPSTTGQGAGALDCGRTAPPADCDSYSVCGQLLGVANSGLCF